jgi:hypothetical protein
MIFKQSDRQELQNIRAAISGLRLQLDVYDERVTHLTNRIAELVMPIPEILKSLDARCLGLYAHVPEIRWPAERETKKRKRRSKR